MVDKTPQVGGGAPLSGQQFSTKGVKLSDLKNQNKLLFDYFKQSGLNENSYVYSTDIEKLKEAYDKNDNGKLSKKEARAIFGEDVSRRDIKKAIKTLDLIAQTDLQGEGTFPVKVSEHETEYYTENNFLQSSVYDDNEKQIKTLYGENKQLRAQIVDKKNEDGTTTRASFLINEYNDDGTLYSCQEKNYGENDSFEETTITYLNGDQNKPSKIEHNVNGNKKVTNIEYNNEGKKMRSVTVANGQKAEIVYDELERPFKQFESPLGSDNITIREYKYNGVGTSPAEVLTTNPDGTQENTVYGEDGKFLYKEQIVKLNPEDLKPKEEKAAAKKNVSAKVHVPDNWGNVATSFRHASGITETKDADAALKALLDARNIKETEVDADKLKADLIKYNPSLFNKDGKVKDNAKWDRLDLPKDIKAQYGKAEAAQNEDKTSTPSGYVPIDSSLPGIPDPKARFNPRNGVGQAGPAKPVEQPKAESKGEEVDIPQKGLDLSKSVVKYSPVFLLPQKKYANQTVLNPDGTSYSYDKYGYIENQYDANGNMTCKIYRTADGAVNSCFDYVYNKEGNIVRKIYRTADGAVNTYSDYVYNKEGELVESKLRHPDGTDCVL